MCAEQEVRLLRRLAAAATTSLELGKSLCADAALLLALTKLRQQTHGSIASVESQLMAARNVPLAAVRAKAVAEHALALGALRVAKESEGRVARAAAARATLMQSLARDRRAKLLSERRARAAEAAAAAAVAVPVAQSDTEDEVREDGEVL